MHVFVRCILPFIKMAICRQQLFQLIRAYNFIFGIISDISIRLSEFILDCQDFVVIFQFLFTTMLFGSLQNSNW